MLNSSSAGSSQGDGVIKKCVSGSYLGTGTGTASKDIECGFVPSYVCVIMYGSDKTPNRMLTYNSDFSSDSVTRAAKAAYMTTQTIGSVEFELTTNGFTLTKNFNQSGYTTYWAAYE